MNISNSISAPPDEFEAPFSPSHGGRIPNRSDLFSPMVATKDSTFTPPTKRFQTGVLHEQINAIGIGWLKTWKKRYFRLRDQSLDCYRQQTDATPKYELFFNASTLVHTSVASSSKAYVFAIENYKLNKAIHPVVLEPATEVLLLHASSQAEKDEWVQAIRHKIQSLPHSQIRLSFHEEEATHGADVEDIAMMEETDRDTRPRASSNEYDLFTAKYALSHEVGQGSFSVVRRATNRETGMLYAVKCTKPTPSLREEVTILRQLNHPNIIRLIDFYDCHDMCYLVFDFMQDGDLCDQLLAHKRFDDAFVRRMIASLALGIQYFHTQNIVHRDLKPENILIHGQLVKIADFGLARQLASSSDQLQKTCGTPEYAAPELLEGRPYGLKCDVFSLGIVAYIMLVGTFPFSIESAKALQQLETFAQGKDVRNMKYLSRDAPQWKHVTELAKDAIIQMLATDPNDRLSITQVLHLEWLTQDQENTLAQAQQDEQKRIREIQQLGIESLLEQGITVIKHGRKGTPHTTLLRWLSLQRQLMWESKGPFQANGPSKIDLTPEAQIVPGHSTSVFECVQEPLDPQCCLSIITSSRSLDLQLPTQEQRDTLLLGLQNLITKS